MNSQPPGKAIGDMSVIKVGGTVFEILIPRPGLLPSFDAVLDLLAERTRRNELTVIGANAKDYGAEEDLGHRPLVNSIGVAAASIPVASLGMRYKLKKFKLPSPRLVGSPYSIRYVCSFAPDPNINENLTESFPLRTDFTVFRPLWTDELNNKGPETEYHRGIDALGLGKTMGLIHQQRPGVMWIDGHRDQFAWPVDESGQIDYSGNMIVFDLYDDPTAIGLLYRGPTPAQCATMFVPLLSIFDYPEYQKFRMGYTVARGEEASRYVFDYIEWGDHTGWQYAFDCSDFMVAAQRAKAQLNEHPEEVPDGNLVSVLAMSYIHLGRYDDARTVYKESLAVMDPGELSTRMVRFNFGQLYYRTGQLDLAAAEFRSLIQLEEEKPTEQTLLDAARRQLSRC